MTLNEIIEFLTSKPGYAKEGAKRLANKVLKGKASIENCKLALQIVNKQSKKETTFDKFVEKDNQVLNNKKEVLISGLKLKARWQGANGKWLESYHASSEFENKLTTQDIEEAVNNSLKNITPVIIPNENIASIKSMLVWTSDKHIGADTTDAQHYKPYGQYIFQSRMGELARKICKVSRELGGLDTLVIADLGDATDGQDGYTASRTHSLPQNLTNRQVFEVYFKEHVYFLECLLDNQIANNYEFWFNTNSNHGGSYEYACHRAFQIYIQTKYPNIKVKSFDKFIGHTEFNGITYILTHGKDDTNRKFGLPLYPDAKTEVFIDNYLKINKLSFNKNIRLIKGDLHQSCSAPCKNINKYRNVASMFGSSGWVMDNYGYTLAGTDYEILDNTTGEILEGTWWYE